MKYDLEQLYKHITREQMEEYIKEHIKISYEMYKRKIEKNE